MQIIKQSQCHAKLIVETVAYTIWPRQGPLYGNFRLPDLS